MIDTSIITFFCNILLLGVPRGHMLTNLLLKNFFRHPSLYLASFWYTNISASKIIWVKIVQSNYDIYFMQYIRVENSQIIILRLQRAMVLRDEKDRPFSSPTRTGFGADFVNLFYSDHGFGPDQSVSGPVRSPTRTSRTGPKICHSYLNEIVSYSVAFQLVSACICV